MQSDFIIEHLFYQGYNFHKHLFEFHNMPLIFPMLYISILQQWHYKIHLIRYWDDQWLDLLLKGPNLKKFPKGDLSKQKGTI